MAHRRQTVINGTLVNGAPPTLHVQRPSDESIDPFEGEGNRCSDTKWHCCVCGSSHSITVRPGPHPLGALACKCPHKPCGQCKTSGQVKAFLPMEEPAMVPARELTKDITFGVICPCCGLSWRAQETGSRYTKTLRKMPSLCMATLAAQQSRLTPENGRLRKSRSTLVLGNKRIVTPPGVEMPRQAEYATVKFSGLECTCGTVIDLSAFCFQVVKLQAGEKITKVEKGVQVDEKKGKIWSTTPELLARGHDKPIINIRGVLHPNPLRSCPVDE